MIRSYSLSPVLRERVGVRGDGEAELERRATQFSKQALTLTLSLRERGQERALIAGPTHT